MGTFSQLIVCGCTGLTGVVVDCAATHQTRLELTEGEEERQKVLYAAGSGLIVASLTALMSFACLSGLPAFALSAWTWSIISGASVITGGSTTVIFLTYCSNQAEDSEESVV